MLIIPLLLTILIECGVLFLLRVKDPIFYLYWIAVTTLTNVPANLCMRFPFFDTATKLALAVAAIELLVIVLEFFLCYLYTKSPQKSIKYSTVCNLASFCVGSAMLAIVSLLF